MRTLSSIAVLIAVIYTIDGRAADLDRQKYTVSFVSEIPGSVAYGINSVGDVVGHSFVFDGRSSSDVHPFEPQGVNSAGAVVGYDVNQLRAGIWRDGSITLLPALDGQTASFAYGINSRGDAVGHSNTSDGRARGVIWAADPSRNSRD